MSATAERPSAWAAPPADASLPPALREKIGVLARIYGESFERQFAGDLAAAQFFFKASRFARRALAELCWPAPAFNAPTRRLDRPLRLGAPELVGEPEFHAGTHGPAHGVAIDEHRGEFTFAEAGALARFLIDLIDRMRERPPGRVQGKKGLTGEEAQTTVEIPARLAQMEGAWSAARRMRPLLDFTAAIKNGPLPPGITPLLFGSLAEPPPWPAYADVDLAFYLGGAALASAPQLLAAVALFRHAAPRIIQTDPIQHHGPYILLETDAACYSPAFLPLRTLRRATTLIETPLALRLAPLAEDRIFSLHSLVAAFQGMRRLAARGPRSFLDRYTAKTFSSLALLVPALCCGCLSRPVDKKTSFEVFKAELDAASVATIEAFERYRLDWRWTLSPPPGLLELAGDRAAWLARTLNRWPSAEAAAPLRALAPQIEPLFAAILDRLLAEARSVAP